MDDTISRQDAIDAICQQAKYASGDMAYVDAIKHLPSVEPVQIVRCKDCKHYHTFEDGISVHISWCDLGHSREIDIYDEWFCGDAKPKEGEEEWKEN